MTFRLLHVCTGNICRSPMAERLTQAGLAARSAADGFVVESAGTWGLGRRVARPGRRAACAELVDHCLRRPLDLVAGPVPRSG